MLIQLPGLLRPEEVARARALLVDAPWIDGRTTAGSQAAAVKNNHQLGADSPAARTLQSLVLGALQRSTQFFQTALPRRVLPPLFNRYAGTTNAYGAHVDQAVRYPPGNDGHSQPLRADLSCTLFLSEPTDYDGGDLVIDDTLSPSAVRLPAGDALLYPANRVHRVAAVTRGERLASCFWVESLVRSHEQRRLLLDMDRALVSLRQRHGESDEALALTGAYHNLLRLWAQT
jgi:PKHD-type hydroxylase